MNPAPAIPPAVPSSVIPPSVPAATVVQFVIKRGGVGEWLPISVAQVSALAAASAPANQAQLPISAAKAATPPLAMTWRAFRRPSSALLSPPFAVVVSRLDETKKARSRINPRQPNPQSVATPTASAAAAPRRVSHLTRRTARARRGASARPAHPVCGSAHAETSGIAPRSRTAHRMAGTPPGVPGSPARPPASARDPGTRRDARRTRGNSFGRSFDISHLDGVIVELALQHLPRPEQTRLHGTDRHLENLGDFLIRHAFHVAQHQGLTKRLRKLIDGAKHLVINDAVEERPLRVFILDLCEDGKRLDRVQIDGLRMPDLPAVFINKGVPQDRKQPSLGIGSLLVLVPGAVGLEHGLLDEIVGVGGIAGEAQSHAVEDVEMHECFVFEARPFLIDGGDRGRGRRDGW